MSLKLSNNQDRLVSFLKSKSISDELFLKLLNLYNWQNEDLFDNNTNRDITLSFINRFFGHRASYNHTDIAHSPATILDIALTTNNPSLLETMLKMPNFKINTRAQEGWKPKSLKEFITINPHINQNTKRLLLNLNDNRIYTLIALNSTLDESEQLEIFNKLDMQGKINLAKNPNLSRELFKKLLNENLETVETLLTHQKIDKEQLTLIKKEYLPLLTNNSNLEPIKDELLFKNRELDFAISKNSAINSTEIEKLYKTYKDEIALNLAKNPNCPAKLLEQFYKQNNIELTKEIASNQNTPEDIIDELFNQNSNELNTHLAKNPNLKSEYIEYFKLDSRLLQIMCQVQDVKSKIAKEII